MTYNLIEKNQLFFNYLHVVDSKMNIVMKINNVNCYNFNLIFYIATIRFRVEWLAKPTYR